MNSFLQLAGKLDKKRRNKFNFFCFFKEDKWEWSCSSEAEFVGGLRALLRHGNQPTKETS